MKELEGEDDVDAFCELCETCLPVKPSVIRDRCRRLGRRVSGKTRTLLVTLANERSAAELLQCARLLRNSQNATGIYINADRTKAEALAAFQERERRRAKRVAARSSTLASADVQEKDARNNNTNLRCAEKTRQAGSYQCFIYKCCRNSENK